MKKPIGALVAAALLATSAARATEPPAPEATPEPLPALPAPTQPVGAPVDTAALPQPTGAPAAPTAETPAAPPSAEPAPRRHPTRELTWDLNLEGGVGKRFLDGEGLGGFGRIRAGLLHIDESDIASPRLLALGLTYDLSDFEPATFGIQGELISVGSGLWAQVGGMIDTEPRPGFMGALGWSLFGAEAQVRWDEPHGATFGLYGKVRIPISVILYALREP